MLSNFTTTNNYLINNMSITLHDGSAAVAIIRSIKPYESFLILRRVSHPKDPWSGHYSFPGGRREDMDQDLFATCVRETREETGILLSSDQLEQTLPLEPAGHKLQNPLWVSPFIFNIEDQPPLTLSSSEVDSAYWLKAAHFKDPRRHKQVEMLQGQLFPAYPLEDYFLWGFTYRLLVTILQLDTHQK